MDKMLHEIIEIPQKAEAFLNQSSSFMLPEQVPYIGMGSSYFAALAFKYMGVEIFPEIASEYYNYLSKGRKLEKGVILSQSGQSSETLWCTHLFEQYIAVSNNTGSELCTRPNVSGIIPLLAGDEQFSSSKTYINTLLALFKGLGFEAGNAIKLLIEKMPFYSKRGEQMAGKVYDLLSQHDIHSIYILGSGPNIATALEASLILSESTKRDFHGLAMAQYDHGPKETAKNSIIMQILAKGISYDRSLSLSEKLIKAGAHVITVEEPDAEENFSILHNIIPFNFLAYYLAQKLNIGETFSVGSKVTKVS